MSAPSLLLLAPVLIPLLGAMLAFIAWGRRRTQKAIGLTAVTLLSATAILLLIRVQRQGILAVQIGNWDAPFGIPLVADLLGALMVTLSGITGLAVGLYAVFYMDRKREIHGFYPLFLALLAGVNGAFLTGDIFNLYVCFEIMLMASFVLLSLGGEKAQLEGAVKYVALNFLSSAIFLAAVGLLYGTAGTLNMADLAVKLSSDDTTPIATIISMLFLVAFGIKAAVFPLFFWLPASYHTPPVPISAVFAGLLTKVGVYAMIRVFTLIFIGDTPTTHTLIVGIALLTMVTGVLGAAAQFDIRRILSFHIVSQIGYMILGLGLFTRVALAGSVFYLAHHIIVKTNLFLIGGIVRRLQGTEDLGRLGGLYRSRPFLAVLFLIPAMSLAGIPPLSGFFAKLFLIVAAIEIRAYISVAVALGVGLLTLYSMTKIWNEAFWKAADRNGESSGNESRVLPLYLPVVGLALLTVLIGLAAGPVFSLSLEAADQLLDPSQYIRAVLGK